jgi:hypothetical protein
MKMACVDVTDKTNTCVGSYRPGRAALHSTKRRLDQAVSYENLRLLPATGLIAEQRAGKEKSRIWGNHVPVVVVFRVGC